MLLTRDKTVIIYIIEHCLRIEEKVKGETFESFETDEDLRDILCFNLLQIGELVKKLPDDLLKKYPEIPWKRVKGERDFIAHGYRYLNNETIWKSSVKEIPLLKQCCQKMLKDN